MTGDFKVSDRLHWYELVISLSLFFGPMLGILLIGNLYPASMNTPIAVSVILGACVLTLASVFWRKKGRVFTIKQTKWTFKHEKTGRTLMEFDLALPHYLAIAIRQGTTGKYATTLNRWLQVFIEQNGMKLWIESPYLEFFDVQGHTYPEICAKIKPPREQILIDAAGKPYTYDETLYLKAQVKPGMALHGLSSYHEGGEDLIKAIMESADSRLDRNMFLSIIKNLPSDQTAFSEFKDHVKAVSGK
ncbi:MAG: hypothetical protein ABFD08_20400 [Syntrophomonas sp.]